MTVLRDLGSVRGWAESLAAEVGSLQVRRRPEVGVPEIKAHANDLVSEVDRASEQLIVDRLRADFPEDAVLGEEGHDVPGRSGWRWVVDPLDGTRNYLSGAGPWSVCLALQEAEVTRLAVVHDPVGRETFSAVRGTGATLNGVPVRIGDTTELERALLGLSFSTAPETKLRMAQMLGVLLPRVGDIRRLPAALNLCWLAGGRLDAALCLDTRLWDVAAGLLIAQEAGADLDEVGPDLLLAAVPAIRPAVRAMVP